MSQPLLSIVLNISKKPTDLDDVADAVRKSYSGPLELICVGDNQNLDMDLPGYQKVVAVQSTADWASSGLQKASGKFVQFLDREEITAPGKLDIQVQHLESFHLAASVTGFCADDEGFRLVESPVPTVDQIYHFIEFCGKATIPVSCALFRRELLAGLSGNYLKGLAHQKCNIAFLPLTLVYVSTIQKGKSSSPTSRESLVNIPEITVANDASHSAGQISVVIPIYNHSAYLEQCILSIAAQTVRPKEIVCVDDASPDPNIAKILQRLKKQIPQMRVVSRTNNGGITAAQNDGVNEASGEFIAFLDCDDYLHTKALAAVAKAINEKPEVDYWFTDRVDVDAHGTPSQYVKFGGYPTLRDDYAEVLFDHMVASHLKVIRKKKILEVGGFDITTSGAQDWDLALKISEVGLLQYLPEPTYFYRIHPEAKSQQLRFMLRQRNRVRRAAQVRRFSERIVSSAGSEPIKTFTKMTSPDDLKNHWRISRDPIVYVIAHDASASTIGFIREFNSYFEQIICETEFHQLMVEPYLWDPSRLIVVDDIKNSIPASTSTIEVSQEPTAVLSSEI
jgi:glycosyltransferase involved in cell wall biosynthesis